MRRVLFAILALMLSVPAMAANSKSDVGVPAPDLNHPRLLVFQIDKGAPEAMNLVINNVNNIIKFYGQDNVKVAVVGFGPGLKTFLNDSPVKDRVESLTAYDNVELLACHNTMEKMKKTEKDLLPGVKVVPAGVVELIERQMAGWTYIAP